jgi:hypothetical protein
MKSLLYQAGQTPHVVPPGCGLCDRLEVPISIRTDGRIYHFVLRDKVVVDDAYLIAVKANAFAIQQGEPYSGQPTPRKIRDFLIKREQVTI